MKKILEYLNQRKTKIKLDIEQDKQINADNYHNVGLLKEIEKVMKVVKVAEKNEEVWEDKTMRKIPNEGLSCKNCPCLEYVNYICQLYSKATDQGDGGGQRLPECLANEPQILKAI